MNAGTTVSIAMEGTDEWARHIEAGDIAKVVVMDDCLEVCPCWHSVRLVLKDGTVVPIGDVEAGNILDLSERSGIHLEEHGMADHLRGSIRDAYDCEYLEGIFGV